MNEAINDICSDSNFTPGDIPMSYSDQLLWFLPLALEKITVNELITKIVEEFRNANKETIISEIYSLFSEFPKDVWLHAKIGKTLYKNEKYPTQEEMNTFIARYIALN